MRKEKRNRREARTGDPRTTNAVQHSQQNSNKDNIVIDVRAAFLDARVILTIKLGRRRECVPSIASVCEQRPFGCIDRHIRDLALALDKFERQTLRGMPGDVAVHEPRAWVVQLEGDGQVAIAREGRDIATSWVHGREGAHTGSIGACLLSHDPKIMSMQMDRVREAKSSRVLDHEQSPLRRSVGCIVSLDYRALSF